MLKDLPETNFCWRGNIISISSRLRKKLYKFNTAGKRIECLKFAEEAKYPNIRVLLTIVCTLPVSSAEAERVTDLIKSSETGCPKKRASRDLLCIQNCENNTKTEKYLSLSRGSTKKN